MKLINLTLFFTSTLILLGCSPDNNQGAQRPGIQSSNPSMRNVSIDYTKAAMLAKRLDNYPMIGTEFSLMPNPAFGEYVWKHADGTKSVTMIQSNLDGQPISITVNCQTNQYTRGMSAKPDSEWKYAPSGSNAEVAMVHACSLPSGSFGKG